MVAGKGMKGMMEGDLIRAAKEGGPKAQQAFTELYRQNAKGAERMIQSYARSGLDVEAAVQEGFTSAFRNLDSFRGDSSFSTWVNRIVINKAKDQLEAMRSRPEGVEITPEMEQTLGHDTTPASIAQNKLLGSRLDEAMGKVDPSFREAFLLKEAEGLSYEEIAAKQGVPVGTVRSRISRAKEQLQRYLKDYSDEVKSVDFSQKGVADLRQTAALAAVAGGAALGAYLNPDDQLKGMLKWAGGTLGAAVAIANIKPKALLESVRRLQQSGPIIKIDELIGQMTAQTKYGKLAVRQLTTAIAKEVPEVARREAIYDYLEGEKSVKLSAAERAVADKARQFFDELGGMAKGAGVIRKLVEDYVTRMYERPTADVMAGKSVLGEGSTSTPFSKPRAFKTRAEAEAAGYVLRTTDIAQVLEAYSDSVTRAVAGKQLIDTLRNVEAYGNKLIVKAKNAPRDYVQVDHPALGGMLVHPDIAPDLRFVFDQRNFGAVVAGLEAINNTQKRMGVSLSLFHATALEHALLGGVSVLKSPLIGAKAFGQSFLPVLFGESIVTKMLNEGGLHPELKRMIDSGLEFSLDRLGKSAVEEERPNMAYQVLGKASQWMDKTIPGAGKYTAGAALELNHMFDQAMWGRFHTTLKAQTFLDKATELYRNNAKLVRQGKAELMSQAEIDRQAASFTNDLYGGLNYYKIANEFQSRFGRELALQVLSPTGRLGMRLLMFAPDWTISTTRAFVKGFGPRAGVAAAGAVVGSQVDTESDTSKLVGGALGSVLGYGAARLAKVRGLEGTGVMGALPAELGGRPANLVDLHRQYFLRSAILYTVLVDTVNYQMSGHHIWDNKDPTRLDRGDGTTMQVSKHFMEPMHWILDPRKQAMGKASFLVKESASQLTDAEYWSPKGAPRMGGVPKDQDVSIGTRAAHAGRQFLPISAQGMELANPQKAGWSAVGMPVYGKTYEERAAAKEAAKAAAIQRRIEKRAREGK
jgi:RNA polymerase sigma-70 factor (ECF subfamily)